MKKNRNTGKGDGQGREQRKFCTNESFGQGRGRNCDYRRNQGPVGSNPGQSIIASVFDGLDKIIARSRKTIALLSGKSDPKLISSGQPDNLLLGKDSSAPGDTSEKTIHQITDKK